MEVTITAVGPAPTCVSTAVQSLAESRKRSSQKPLKVSGRSPSNLSSQNSTKPFKEILTEQFHQNSTTQLSQNLRKPFSDNSSKQFRPDSTPQSSQNYTEESSQNLVTFLLPVIKTSVLKICDKIYFANFLAVQTNSTFPNFFVFLFVPFSAFPWQTFNSSK